MEQRETNRARRALCVVAAMAGLATMVVAAGPTATATAEPAAAPDAPVTATDAAIGPVGPGGVYNLTVAGRGGVPATGASAVALNVTATNPTAGSYLTIYPAGADRPTASNLNFNAGQTIPNMVIVPVGAGGQISIYNFAGTVDVLVDVLGWYPTGNTYTGLNPARLLDTRPGTATIDGASVGIGPVGPGAVLNLTVTGRGGVPATAASAVALNVTATNPTAGSYLTIYPTGAPQPTASNLNFTPGQTIPNMVIVPVGAGGQISIYNDTGTVDVLVDVLGWFPAGNAYTGLNPARLLDTRPGTSSTDNTNVGTGPVGPGGVFNLGIAGRGGVPATGASAVALNVTATNPTAGSYLTIYPAGADRPTASNLNFTPGKTIPNMVIVPVGANGQISIYNDTGTVDVLVDVLGWFPTGNTYTGLNPFRLLDTRIPLPATPPVAPPAFGGPIANLVVVTPGGQRMVGVDRIAVWVCDVPANTTDPSYQANLQSNGALAVDLNTVVAWAQQNVAPYFANASNAQFQATFTPLGRIPLAASDSSLNCLDKAETLTPAPYTNVLVTDTSFKGNGFGGPGSISSRETDNYYDFTKPPSVTGRGFWVGGGSIIDRPAPTIVIHELGHTLKWPHSYIDQNGYEYNNPTDVMSGKPTDGWCSKPYGPGGTVQWPCVAQNTIAFNRFAAGWIDESQVLLQQSGTQAFTFGVPSAGGTQLLVAPDPGDSRVMLTLEGRPRIGNDSAFPVEGVVVHIVDQRPGRCFTFAGAPCTGTERRQSQALGAPNSYDHVLQVGTTTVINGVTITVSGKSGDSFTGQVSGTFIAPTADPLPPSDAAGDTDVYRREVVLDSP